MTPSWKLNRVMERLAKVADVVGPVAVVLSLIYVGLEIRQNTRAILTSTSQAVYSQYLDSKLPLVEDAEFAELLILADTAPASLTEAQQERLVFFHSFEVNLYEAVFTNTRLGTMDREIADAWLAGMGDWICRPRARDYWSDWSYQYHAGFRAMMDSVAAVQSCVARGETER